MVRHEYENPNGNVVGGLERQELRAADLFFQRGRKDRQYAGSTLLAMLCDNAELQPHLPQIWLPKDTTHSKMSDALWRKFISALDDKYPQQLWAGTSGWMTAPVFGVVLRLLRERVDSILGQDYAVVLVFDAAGAHANKEVFQLAVSLNMVIVLIPGQLTWLLQMLDVKVFGRLKATLRQEFMRARMASATGHLEPHQWVDISVQAVDTLLVRTSWPRAFDSMRVPAPEVPAWSYKRLQAIAPPEDALPLMPFTPDQLDAILGRHRVELVPLLFEEPVRLMPPAAQLALRDRLRSERQSALALEAPPAAPAGDGALRLAPVSAAPPPPGADCIARRVALRRRSASVLDLDPDE